MSNSSTDDGNAIPSDEALPHFSGLDPKECTLGRRVFLPIPQSDTKQKKYKGGTNIEQEYICSCDKVFTDIRLSARAEKLSMIISVQVLQKAH